MPAESFINMLMGKGPSLPGPSPANTVYAPNPGSFANAASTVAAAAPALGLGVSQADTTSLSSSFQMPAPQLDANGAPLGLGGPPTGTWSVIMNPGASGIQAIPGTKLPDKVPFPEDFQTMVGEIQKGIDMKYFNKKGMKFAPKFIKDLTSFTEWAPGKTDGQIMAKLAEYRSGFNRLMNQKSLNARIFGTGGADKGLGVTAAKFGMITFVVGMVMSFLHAKNREKTAEIKQLAEMQKASLNAQDAEGLAAQNLLPHLMANNQMLLQGISGGQYAPPAEANTQLLKMMMGQLGQQGMGQPGL